MTTNHDSRMMEMMQGLFSREEGLRHVLALILQMGLEAEVSEYLGAHRYERTGERRGYRAGSKPRTLHTRVGTLEFAVPQVKCADGPYRARAYERYQRHEVALLAACAEMYFQGVSTRKTQAVLETLCGGDISAATVSRAAAELDEKLQSFRARRLDAATYPFLIIDARYEKVRRENQVRSTAVLVVAGINAGGRREILDWSVDDSESEATWSALLVRLKQRGLHGVELVVSDAHRGIRAAIARHAQGAAWQRCKVHFIREALKKVGWRSYRELAADLRCVFRSETAAGCRQCAEEIAAKWDARGVPRLAEQLREGVEDCCAVYALAPALRRRLNSTNMLERVMREIKRRTAVVGIFPNPTACDRLVGALLLEMHETWQLEMLPYLPLPRHEPREPLPQLARLMPLVDNAMRATQFAETT
jgi:putative transposase